MSELQPIPFADLLRRMRSEVARSGAIFDLPVKRWWLPDGEHDFGATHFGRRASTPIGPAAGPHTQLAQNLVLAWLGGGRILELKTVQVNDRLEIPRPCIHAPQLGFNVEWSQELRVHESLLEYAKAVFLIEILKASDAFGACSPGQLRAAGETIYDISVGYDLAGIRSELVAGFLQGMREPAALFERLRGELQGELSRFRDVELPESISGCVTLSTFHGCPADEIESIARHLIEERGLHTIIKLNPTLLGFERVRELLHDRLGYTHLALRREAFDEDLQYDDALAMLRRLGPLAREHGTRIGAKFTNTLVVANDPDIFPTQSDPSMYLSGPPLHVIAMTLMQQLREDLDESFPVSFSAGIHAGNVAAALSCGMVPVTTCTDLLRQGGYGRLPRYLAALQRAMDAVGVSSREAWVLAARGHGAEAAEAAVRALEGGAALWSRVGAQLARTARDAPDALPGALRHVAFDAGVDGDDLLREACWIAGRLNGRELVPALVDDPAYHAAANDRAPKRIDSQLERFDCINCDLCIHACPNDAIFAYTVQPTEQATELLSAGADGTSDRDADGVLQRGAGAGFVLRESHQLGVFEGACNECSNCEVYCPEEGAPHLIKERVFASTERFAGSEQDGFCRVGDALHARLDGVRLEFTPRPEQNRASLRGDDLQLELTWEPLAVTGGQLAEGRFDTATLWRLRTAWESIFQAARPNPVQPAPAAAASDGPGAGRDG